MINQPTILIIDDIKDNILILKTLILEYNNNAVVLSAQSGKRGIELAKSTNPDLIFLDVLMPQMDGFEVCRIIKSDKELSATPVVFVTALKEDKKT